MQVERPVLRYFGGKWMLADWIQTFFPEHKIYVEPYGGAASVLMRKKRVKVEVYNDLDNEIVNVFRVLRDTAAAQKLYSDLLKTPYSREEYDKAHEPCDDIIENARRVIIRSFMGHGADSVTGKSKSGFRSNSNQSNRAPALDWINYPPEVQKFTDRLAGVVIENRPALDVMKAHDSLETLFFVDPPYVSATRKRTKAYRHEMTDTEHLKLAEFLMTLKGMVVLAGYDNPIYDILDWHEFSRPSLADGAQKRTETVWLNSSAFSAKSQMELKV